jgi:hypothetical protein
MSAARHVPLQENDMVYQYHRARTDEHGQYFVWAASILLFVFGMSIAYWVWPGEITELTFVSLLREIAAGVIALTSVVIALTVGR